MTTRSTTDRLTDGMLTCEQRLRVPEAISLDLASVLDRLERAHFAEVERATLGLIRCRRRADGVVCAAAGCWPALAFGAPETTLTPTTGHRSWPIREGLLARPSQALGTLTLAAVRDGDGLLLISAVDRFPSRLLGAPPPGMPLEVWQLVGSFYVRYHRRVSFRSLERVAREVTECRPWRRRGRR